MINLFFDTETTGIPNWKIPSESEEQPHIVQIAAILCDSDTKEIKEEIELIVRPDGWVIPDEVAEINGITTERVFSYTRGVVNCKI